MNGLSLLATVISVLSFPLAFLALLYPHIASPKGRWRGFFLYIGTSAATLLLAVLTATRPNVGVEDWMVMDWLILLIGGGLILAVLTRKWWRASSNENDSSSLQQTQKSPGRNRSKPSRKRKSGKIQGTD